MEKKYLDNINIASLITITSLLIWLCLSVYGCIIGGFEAVFLFFQKCFFMILGCYIGSKTKEKKMEKEAATVTNVEELEVVDNGNEW